MGFKIFKNTVLLCLLVLISCANSTHSKTIKVSDTSNTEKPIVVGANRLDLYLPDLQGKRVAVVANQSSVIFKDETETSFTHLVDSLLDLKIDVKKVFAPEHGFRGKGDAGELIANSTDVKTGLPIISLHGTHRKPRQEDLSDVDIVVFDIQDVGVRFYTYLSTMHYVMEACAEAGIPVIILDRPNPNGHYIDGPVLKPEHKSFVGLHPVPLVYGMTIGEYAKMINGEHWLADSLVCDLKVIPLENYTHETPYSLPIKPSPNLPNDQAINLYPSLDIFRGTVINVGRGTDMQMQVYGAPFFPKSEFSFTPRSNEGATHPRFENQLCYGVDLRNEPRLSAFNLKYLIDAYAKTPKDVSFFGPTFTAHAGNTELQEQIEAGISEDSIRASWQKDIDAFKEIRKKYLLYD
ncbi:exo-beta-N-acetylmuramidase NamZ family protein [Gaetbulibacter aestuarii]|uniref:DUF1343 domain-containing protein n=1 Tax=Gaetbulibacter aestuarii TaxID=1502358 RepID=A0ABW7MYH7_9FLAO